MNKILNALGLISKKELAEKLKNCTENHITYKTEKDPKVYYFDMGALSIISHINHYFEIKY